MGDLSNFAMVRQQYTIFNSPPLHVKLSSNTNLDLVELLVCTCFNLNALPEPLLLDHVDPGGRGRGLGGVNIIRHHHVGYPTFTNFTTQGT